MPQSSRRFQGKRELFSSKCVEKGGPCVTHTQRTETPSGTPSHAGDSHPACGLSAAPSLQYWEYWETSNTLTFGGKDCVSAFREDPNQGKEGRKETPAAPSAPSGLGEYSIYMYIYVNTCIYMYSHVFTVFTVFTCIYYIHCYLY